MTTRPSVGGMDATDETSTASVGQLVASIREDMSGLVRDEIDLAKAEIREDVKAAGIGSGLVAMAGILGALAFILLSIALAYGISALGLAPGWAFLIVAGFYLLVAAGLVLGAKNRFSSVHGPKRAQIAARQATQALRTRRSAQSSAPSAS